MNRIFIYIAGGVLQAIYSSEPDELKVTVVDRDDDHSEPVVVNKNYQVMQAPIVLIDQWTAERLKEEAGE